jgi:DNA-binding LacI/PurR family transcriptional regulator
MTVTTSKNKWQFLANDLSKRIASGDLRAGEPIPTYNELVDQYGVALGTVRMAVMQLQNDGLIWSQRGKGTFVASADKTRRRKIAAKGTIGLLMAFNSHWPGISEQVSWLQHTVEEQGFHFSVRWCKTEQMDSEIQRMGELTGLVLWGGATFEQLERWAKTGLRIVQVGLPMDGRVSERVSYIEFDIPNMIIPLTDLIFGMGHRKVGLSLLSHTAYFDQLAHCFMEAAKEAFGVENQCRVDYTPDGQEDAFIRRIIAADDPPTAMIIENDVLACRYIHHFQNQGWVVPQRISIAAIGALDQCYLAVPGLTRVFSSSHDIITRALDALLVMIRTGRLVQKQVSLRLQPGNTCQPVSVDHV